MSEINQPQFYCQNNFKFISTIREIIKDSYANRRKNKEKLHL